MCSSRALIYRASAAMTSSSSSPKNTSSSSVSSSTFSPVIPAIFCGESLARVLLDGFLDVQVFIHERHRLLATLAELFTVEVVPRTFTLDGADLFAGVKHAISSWEMNRPNNHMSNSAILYGGATLFFATFTLQRTPASSSPALPLMTSLRRMSRRTLE